MDLQLKGLKVLVTGASKGLGYAVAECFVNEGCQVAINSRSGESLHKAADRLGSKVTTIAADVSKPESCSMVVAEAVEKMGGLDILVSNAGGPPTGKFTSLDDSVWLSAVDLCLMFHVRLIRAAIPYLEKSKAGSILTITSISAKQPIDNLVLSNTLRSGVLGLTKTLALELAPQGIRCNSILPSWTKTERAISLLQGRADSNHTSLEDELNKQSASSPLGRLAEPEEFARPAVFLASPAASYLTGVMLSVDGGSYKGIL